MGEKIVVGPINKGLKLDREPFVIDNDSFPVLQNAYQWRGRVKRKRGTEFLCRLDRFINSTLSVYVSGSSTIALDGSGDANLLTGFSLDAGGAIVPGTVILTDTITATVYTDPSEDGTLSPSGTINYATGDISIVSAAGNTLSAIFEYFPQLPVMGLRDLQLDPSEFPGTLAFDTKYAYNILTNSSYSSYSVSFYKKPTASASLPGYIPTTVWNPVIWNGKDYQQFWTTNYQGALWVTNGIQVPFSTTNIGMQFKLINTVTVLSPTTANLNITGHGLFLNDFVFVNEVVTTTGINFQTGYVTTVAGLDDVIVTFPNATLAGNGTGGIAQYLTNTAVPGKDCIRWYDGDPTNKSPTSPVLVQGKGWVNFMPPLSQFKYSIANLPAQQYYLVGARVILPFKDRLLFFGPVIQTSGINSSATPIYLPDTIIYSQNGTAFYTASFTTTNITSTTTQFNPILVPTNQTATATAYFEDSPGFAGFQSVGIAQPIVTVSPNKDVLILGFSNSQVKLIYTGNDIIPFNFFTVNSEYGSTSTFSVITMDRGVLSRGTRGLVTTDQTDCERIDLEIPDTIFESRLTDNGNERFCAQRDYINEWIYFTYPPNSDNSTSSTNYFPYPQLTLQLNYRDNSWGVFLETYTTYGSFRKNTGNTWSTIGNTFKTWASWNQPWNYGDSTLLQQVVIAGNQQGFVLVRGQGTSEAPSLAISSFNANTLTVTNHGLNTGDYIFITNATGDVAQYVNNQVFSITVLTTNTFYINPTIPNATYNGNGLITRFYVPFIQTKQFPVSWGMARKTRLGTQQYLLTYTDQSQIQLLIFLSQNGDYPYNLSPIVPAIGSTNNSLVYSEILFTCPESENIGLTPANTNLNLITASQQNQIWHRMNTSLIGDTVQIGFTMSDEQMTTLSPVGNAFDITGITTGTTTTITTTANFGVGTIITVKNVFGTTELNGGYWYVTSSTSSELIINALSVNPYISGGTVQVVIPVNQTDEIEIHGMILDVSPSQVLA